MINNLIILFIGHWFGDYVFQTSRMALQKSVGIKWLSIHVTVYTLVLFLFAYFIFNLQAALTFAALNGVFHFITDFFTSRLSKKYRDKPRVFFPIIGFDQLIHAICLMSTASKYFVEN
jgi:hypothetical protein